MTDPCESIQAKLQQGRALEPDEAAHLAGCEDCARAELEAAVALPEDVDTSVVLASLRGDLEEETGLVGWWRSRPTALRRAVVLLVLLGTAVGLGLLRPRADLGVFPMPRMMLLVGLYGAVGALASLGALGSGRRPVVRPPLAGLGLGVAVVVSFGLALLPPAHSAHPASLGGTGAELLPRALACLLTGLAVALPGVVLLGLGARATGHSLRAPWVLAAMAGALAGQLALQLHCPLVGAGHRVAGHALLVVVLGLVTWAVAERLAARG
jgi:hypothetical protein